MTERDMAVTSARGDVYAAASRWASRAAMKAVARAPRGDKSAAWHAAYSRATREYLASLPPEVVKAAYDAERERIRLWHEARKSS